MATRQYIGARYVPKFADPVEWDSIRSYEALTIVSHLGNSFTSKKPVPAGIDIGNTDYWVNTGNYNEQVELYRKEIDEYKKYVDNICTYVTPELFGAKGDGSDDTLAVQSAINTGKRVLMTGTYTISSALIISPSQNQNIEIDGDKCNIIYTGDGSAVKIQNVFCANIRIGWIQARNGTGIEFIGNDDSYVQYINLYCRRINAKNDCIRINVTAKWVNEINIFNTWLNSGTNGIHTVCSKGESNRIKCYNVGFEGITNALNMEATGEGTISNYEFHGCRIEETYEKLAVTSGKVTNFIFFSGIGYAAQKKSDFTFGSDKLTTGWRFICGNYQSIVENSVLYVLENITQRINNKLIILTEGTNLNDVLDLGYYITPSNSVATSLINTPSNESFIMHVIPTVYGGEWDEGVKYRYATQIVLPLSSSKCHVRTISVENGTSNVGTWKSVSFT